MDTDTAKVSPLEMQDPFNNFETSHDHETCQRLTRGPPSLGLEACGPAVYYEVRTFALSTRPLCWRTRTKRRSALLDGETAVVLDPPLPAGSFFHKEWVLLPLRL